MLPPPVALCLAAAGAAGTLLRAGENAAALGLVGPGFPCGTLAVNVAALAATWAVLRLFGG
jgi:fluoride ion exporter CrcB/FEX